MKPSEALIRDVSRHLGRDNDFRIGLTYILNAEHSSGYFSNLTLSDLARAYPLPQHFETRWHKEALSQVPALQHSDKQLQGLRYLIETVLPREIDRIVVELNAEQKKIALEDSPFLSASKRQSTFVDMAMRYLLGRHPNAADHLKSIQYDSSLISIWSRLILLNVWKNLFEGLLEDAELGRTLDLRIRKDTIVEAMNHHFERNPIAIASNELKSTIWDTYRFPKHIEDTFSTSFHKAVDSMNKKFVRQGKGPLIVTKSKKG
jgi:hypothetical protein